MSKNIEKAIKYIQTKLDDENFLFCEDNAEYLLSDLHYKIRKELEIKFGEESDGTCYGSFSNLYSETQAGKYDCALVYSYWSFSGIPYTEQTDTEGKWRSNFFYKGKQFSDINKRKQFYKLFNIVTSFINGYVPLDYLAHRLCIKKQVNLLTITNQNHLSSVKNSVRSNISLPIFHKTGLDKNSNLYKFTTEIEEAKASIKSAATIDEENKIKKRLSECFDRYFESAKADFKKEWVIDNSNILDNDINSLYSLCIGYQFYNHDGIIILCVPNETSINNRSCFGFIIPKGNIDCFESKKNEIDSLLDQLKPLAEIEKRVWSDVGKNLHTKLIWKNFFNQTLVKYRQFCNHIEVLIDAICQELKIENYIIQYRIKDFDSFYKRIVDRFNDPKSYYISEEDIKPYRNAVNKPTEKNIQKVLERFWDIAGLRLILNFQSDKQKLKSFITKSNNPTINEEIHNSNIGCHFFYHPFNDSGDYKAEHYIIRLGDERCNLFELKNLKGLKCELQVKTNLEHGWSDVDHDLFYKSRIPKSQLETILSDDSNPLNLGRSWTSNTLSEIDTKFDFLKKNITKIIRDVEE